MAQTIDQLFDGEKVYFKEVRAIFVSGDFGRQAELWCVRHNIPTEKRERVIRELVERCLYATITLAP